MRLQKYMAHCGVASRRSAEQIILAGRVMVNGIIVTELGTSVEPGVDVVLVDGKEIQVEETHVYIMLNKPSGYITSVKDNFSRPTALDLVPLDRRVYPVGRLDYDSEGLILLTDDGALTHLLTHPSHEFEKRYLVETDRLLSDPALEALRSGVDLGDYMTHPATVERQREYRKLIIGIHEGKNRQIRRMIEALGAEVKLLRRLSIGPLEMGDLKLGAWRYLTAEEIEALKALK
ncbi:MAG: pseudouridine synthase [Erysipelotrichaceae bacterium]|nr:pseudouridine synthase [Erysipelotrichaceae bacterium]